MAKYELLLRTEFTASHQLRMHDGELEPLHSHDWRVEVFLEGEELDAAGLVADFTVLQRDLTQITVDLRGRLLNEFDIEISGGLGELKNKIWRVGLMGYSSQRGNVLLFLSALETILLDLGVKLPAGAGIAAATSVFAHAEPVPVGHGK